eukprot:TRINITY_DN4522_c0_g3_i1.p1 TRINITY_DN4522_c0_g3~~TRINITY_DN4522_c0_g3_i1.p1  ORF type:complete len:1327 (+),score=344.23 TRINITY_DN4522_c0_g3_i1:474-3983(+)
MNVTSFYLSQWSKKLVQNLWPKGIKTEMENFESNPDDVMKRVFVMNILARSFIEEHLREMDKTMQEYARALASILKKLSGESAENTAKIILDGLALTIWFHDEHTVNYLSIAFGKLFSKEFKYQSLNEEEHFCNRACALFGEIRQLDNLVISLLESLVNCKEVEPFFNSFTFYHNMKAGIMALPEGQYSHIWNIFIKYSVGFLEVVLIGNQDQFQSFNQYLAFFTLFLKKVSITKTNSSQVHQLIEKTFKDVFTPFFEPILGLFQQYSSTKDERLLKRPPIYMANLLNAYSALIEARDTCYLFMDKKYTSLRNIFEPISYGEHVDLVAFSEFATEKAPFELRLALSQILVQQCQSLAFWIACSLIENPKEVEKLQKEASEVSNHLFSRYLNVNFKDNQEGSDLISETLLGAPRDKFFCGIIFEENLHVIPSENHLAVLTWHLLSSNFKFLIQHLTKKNHKKIIEMMELVLSNRENTSILVDSLNEVTGRMLTSASFYEMTSFREGLLHNIVNEIYEDVSKVSGAFKSRMKKVMEESEDVSKSISQFYSLPPFDSLALPSDSLDNKLSKSKLRKISERTQLITIFPVRYFTESHQKSIFFSMLSLEGILYQNVVEKWKSKTRNHLYNTLSVTRSIVSSFSREGLIPLSPSFVNWLVLSQIHYSSLSIEQTQNMKESTIDILQNFIGRCLDLDFYDEVEAILKSIFSSFNNLFTKDQMIDYKQKILATIVDCVNESNLKALIPLLSFYEVELLEEFKKEGQISLENLSNYSLIIECYQMAKSLDIDENSSVSVILRVMAKVSSNIFRSETSQEYISAAIHFFTCFARISRRLEPHLRDSDNQSLIFMFIRLIVQYQSTPLENILYDAFENVVSSSSQDRLLFIAQSVGEILDSHQNVAIECFRLLTKKMVFREGENLEKFASEIMRITIRLISILGLELETSTTYSIYQSLINVLANKELQLSSSLVNRIVQSFFFFVKMKGQRSNPMVAEIYNVICDTLVEIVKSRYTELTLQIERVDFTFTNLLIALINQLAGDEGKKLPVECAQRVSNVFLSFAPYDKEEITASIDIRSLLVDFSRLESLYLIPSESRESFIFSLFGIMDKIGKSDLEHVPNFIVNKLEKDACIGLLEEYSIEYSLFTDGEQLKNSKAPIPNKRKGFRRGRQFESKTK